MFSFQFKLLNHTMMHVICMPMSTNIAKTWFHRTIQKMYIECTNFNLYSIILPSVLVDGAFKAVNTEVPRSHLKGNHAGNSLEETPIPCSTKTGWCGGWPYSSMSGRGPQAMGVPSIHCVLNGPPQASSNDSLQRKESQHYCDHVLNKDSQSNNHIR